MAEDGWDDLFAKAAGAGEKEKSPKPTQRKPIKTRTEPALSTIDSVSFEQVLAQRMRVPGAETSWPAWTRLSGNMSSKVKCDGWEEDEAKQNASRQCKTCREGPLQHKLVVDKTLFSESSQIWPFRLFCNIRNIRCIGTLVITEEKNRFDWAQHTMNELVHNISRDLDLDGLPPEWVESHFDKRNEILHAVQTLYNNACEHERNSRHLGEIDDLMPIFDETVRVIIACDDFYYRLYYLQISEVLPTYHYGSHSLYIPHPAEYFHIPGLAWEGMESASNVSALKAFLKSMLSPGSESSVTCRPESFGDEFTRRYGVDASQSVKLAECDDVLSYLHGNRVMETVRLFHSSGWSSSNVCHDQTVAALKSSLPDQGLSRHETAAPPVLTEWRDSCRDRLCNLYAYATVPNQAVQRIKSHLLDAELTEGIVEVGAGTGYLAALLQKAGISVVAWDLSPTDGSKRSKNRQNEYHARTPPFCDVTRGHAFDLHRCTAAPDAALLLCYPPPDSPMANQALTTFLEVGGRCFVHVGEVGGLTGSSAFEGLLVGLFTCVDRVPCVSWGTDAAEVTIWMTNYDGRARSLLLQCSSCGKVEATKRCRLVRHVAYCGDACFKKHSPLLSTHLGMSMLTIRADELSFGNDRHFVPLRVPSATKTKQDETTPASTRQKNKRQRFKG